MATLTIADLDNGKRDLQTVDAVANSRAATATTRHGQQTTTLYEAIRRINATGDEILSNLGFRVPVPYAPGLNVTDSRFTVTGPDGKAYAPLSAPFTTGAWDPAQWYVLQNDLNDHKLLVFNSYVAASAAAATLPDGQVVDVVATLTRYDVLAGALANARPITPFTAEGGTTRSVQSKLSDTPTPFDYGAAGDGVTDDTERFNALEAEVVGRVVDLLGRVYKTTKTFYKNTYTNGFWLVEGKRVPVNGALLNAKAPAWNVREIGKESASAVRFIPLAAGRGGVKTLQSVAYDPAGRVFYTNHNTQIDSNPTVLSVWNKYSTDGGVINNASDFMLPDDRLGHQGIAVQKLADGQTKLWTTAPESPIGTALHPDFDFTIGAAHGVVRFDWVTNTAGEAVNVDLFRLVESSRTAGSSTTPTITLDGKWLIIRFTDEGIYNNQTFRVFDLSLLTTPGDYSAMCTHEFTIPLESIAGPSVTSLSGFCSDGAHLYMFCGNTTFGQTQYLASCDLLGRNVVSAVSTLGDTDAPRIVGATPMFRESEGMGFIDFEGKLFPSVVILTEPSVVSGGTRRTALVYALGAATMRNADPQTKRVSLSNAPEKRPVTIESAAVDGETAEAMVFNNPNGTTTSYKFRRNGATILGYYASTTNTAILAGGTNDLILGCGGFGTPNGWAWKINAVNKKLQPYTDNAQDFGEPANRVRNSYLGNNPVVTSDGREKTAPAAVEDVVLDAWADVQIIMFQWLSAVREKGQDLARWHFGVIAQQVRDAFAARGLDGTSYGLLCYDEWDDIYEPIMATRSVTLPDGSEAVEEYDTGEVKLVTSAGNRWGIRADQCHFLEAAYQRRERARDRSKFSEFERAITARLDAAGI